MKKVKNSALKIVALVLFSLVCFLVVMVANGYWFDFRVQKLKRLSIVHIDARKRVDGVGVYFEGKLLADKFPLLIKGVEEGKFEIKVTKDGFQDVVARVEVERDLVTRLNDFRLVPWGFDDFVVEKVEIDVEYTVAYLTERFFVLNGVDDVVVYRLFDDRFSRFEKLKGVDLSLVEENDQKLLLKKVDGGKLIYSFENKVEIESVVEEEVLFRRLKVIGELVVLWFGERAEIVEGRFDGVVDGKVLAGNLVELRFEDGKRKLFYYRDGKLNLISDGVIGKVLVFGGKVYYVGEFGAVYTFDLGLMKIVKVVEGLEGNLVGGLGWPWVLIEDGEGWWLYNFEFRQKFVVAKKEEGDEVDWKVVNGNLVRAFPKLIEKFEF